MTLKDVPDDELARQTRKSRDTEGEIGDRAALVESMARLRREIAKQSRVMTFLTVALLILAIVQTWLIVLQIFLAQETAMTTLSYRALDHRCQRRIFDHSAFC